MQGGQRPGLYFHDIFALELAERSRYDDLIHVKYGRFHFDVDNNILRDNGDSSIVGLVSYKAEIQLMASLGDVSQNIGAIDV